MSNAINLLPNDLNIKSSSGKVGVLLKRLTVSLVFVLLVVVAAGSGLIFYLSRQVNTLESDIAQMKNQIDSLSANEQKFFLIKDRIAKVEKLFADKQTEDTIGKLDQTVAALPQDMNFKDAKFEGSNASLSVASNNSLEAADYVESVIKSPLFSQIILRSLGFNTFNGYVVNLEMF